MFQLKRTFLCRMIFLGALLLPFTAFAAGTISVVKSGDNSFTLQANGLGAPAGFDITVNYDSSRLSNPRVVQGSLASGAMLAANTGLPGMVRFALVSVKSLSGSGPIASITFDRIGDSPGTITVAGTVLNLAGVNLPVSFRGWSAPVENAGGSAETVASGSGSSSGGTSGTATGSTGPGFVGGTFTMPSDDAGLKEKVKEKEAPVAPTPQEPDADVAVAPAPAEIPVSSEPAKVQQESPRPVPSVLEKFRLFSGEKTPQNLAALFDRDPAAFFSQTPPIGIADGKAGVKLLISKLSGDKAPNFTFNSARYLHLTQKSDGAFQLEVRPDQGSLKASIGMVTEGGVQEIPLTVSPYAEVDLDKSGQVNEADFLLFLKTPGSQGAPKFDLNADGRRDYLDDYIFTANYLVRTAAKDKKGAAPQKAK